MRVRRRNSVRHIVGERRIVFDRSQRADQKTEHLNVFRLPVGDAIRIGGDRDGLGRLALELARDVDPRLVVGVLALIFGCGDRSVVIEDKADDGIVPAGAADARRTLADAESVFFAALHIGELVDKTVKLDVRAHIRGGEGEHIRHGLKEGALIEHIVASRARKQNPEDGKDGKQSPDRVFHIVIK